MTITGSVDGFIPPNKLSGWALATPHDTVTVRVMRAGECIGEVIASVFRKDLNTEAGFQIEVEGEIDPIELVTGRIAISASRAVGQNAILSIWDGLLQRLLPLALEFRAKRLTNDEWREFMKIALQHAEGQSRNRLEPLAVRQDTQSEYLATPDLPPGELSSFSLRPGLRSPSGVAAIGRNGNLFVTGGSNSLLEQYRQDPQDDAVKNTGTAWISLFEKRHAALEARGIRYAQLIIPEKSSVLPENYPFGIVPPTPLFSNISTQLSKNRILTGAYCDVLRVTTSHLRRNELFRRLDSHLTPFGCHEVFAALLAHLGCALHPVVHFDQSTLWGGDLVEHFPGFRFIERVDLPEKQRILAIEKRLEQTEFYFPGYHNGMHATWKNLEAPIPLRVVAFANSFFGIGDKSSTLSWWAARWFREFHFRWSPDFNYGYIDQVQPDLVIGQTVERFLPVVPAS